MHDTTMIIDDSPQGLESMALLLRQEREQLIVAWEQLESEQRQLALEQTGRVPTRPPQDAPPPEPEVAQAPVVPIRQRVAMPAPPSIVRTVRAAAKTAGAHETFRFLQREFDRPNKKRTP